FIVATATSMDGYASVGAAMILDGMKVTVTTRPPKAIIADTEVLQNAPMKMLQAGYGDIVGKYSCLNDWKLSALVNDEHFCQKIFDYMMECTNNVTGLAEGLLRRDKKTVGILMEALVTVGVLMCFVGSSRPASGSEHHLSHFFEITGILNDAPYFDHGIDVLYSAYFTQLLREELLSFDHIQPIALIENEKYEQEIVRIYNKLAPEVLALQNKLGWVRLDRFPMYKEKWTEIKALLSETPSSAQMKEYISAIGLDLREFEEMYGKEKIQDAIFFAKDLKDRYSVLWLYFNMFFTESEARRIL
ncbi:MAG: iron-containing alcohol dehydrogenase, partial [Clostridia bacterium]|nr:iron-containing alcohol dehydrogenase [Clostridia bacterium]